MATPTQIKDRLVLNWSEISGVVTSLDDYPNDDLPFEDAELPAAVTRLMSSELGPVRVTRRHTASGIILERWEISTILHVCALDKMDALAPNTTEMELCEPFLRSPAAYFAQHDRLHTASLNDLVYGSEAQNNTGIVKIIRPKVVYWGIVYTLPVLEEFYYGYD
jgi:hypothetical protein